MIRDVMTIDEVAEYLQVNPRTVRRAIWNGEMSHIRIGRLVRVEASQLDAFLEARRVEPAKPWVQL